MAWMNSIASLGKTLGSDSPIGASLRQLPGQQPQTRYDPGGPPTKESITPGISLETNHPAQAPPPEPTGMARLVQQFGGGNNSGPSVADQMGGRNPLRLQPAQQLQPMSISEMMGQQFTR